MPEITLVPKTPEERSLILIDAGLLTRPEVFEDHVRGKLAAIVTDSAVAPLYLPVLTRTLAAAGARTVSLVLPQGETTKSREELSRVQDFLLESGITRSDVVVALGGGAIGDLTGLCAATTLRGIPLIQVSTTLLSQVDASVGGKVAVNHPLGKNLIGAFCHPSLVVIDTSTLHTLPPRQIGSGLGEVIKVGCIRDAALLELLESCADREEVLRHAPQIVHRCIAVKADVVSRDPLDRGERMILNFGHTLAHALERESGYGQILHGEAVCLGMLAACTWGEELGITPAGMRQRLYRLLSRLDLPCTLPEGIRGEEVLADMLHDKKAAGKTLRLILLDAPGSCRIVPVDGETLTRLLHRTGGLLWT